MMKNNKKHSGLYEILRRLCKNKFAMAGLIVLLIIILIAIFAPVFLDYENDVIKQNIKERLQAPSSEHWLGTDNYGRDILNRILYGSRVSLTIGFVAVGVSLLIGGALGIIAAYFGGLIDNVIMRVTDVFLALPAILLAIAVVSALGSGMVNLTIAMTIAYIPPNTRLVRSLVLPIKDIEYIEAARATGVSVPRIMLSHIVPNIMGAVFVQSTINVGRVIIAAAGMSFLGLGIIPPSPEWGAMLSEGREYLRTAPHLVVYPGIAIMLTVLSLNLLGDGLNDAIDPRLNS